MPALLKSAPVVLAKVPSSSTPGTFHEIRLGRDNQAYCTCKGWKFCRSPIKTCAHLRAFKASR